MFRHLCWIGQSAISCACGFNSVRENVLFNDEWRFSKLCNSTILSNSAYFTKKHGRIQLFSQLPKIFSKPPIDFFLDMIEHYIVKFMAKFKENPLLRCKNNPLFPSNRLNSADFYRFFIKIGWILPIFSSSFEKTRLNSAVSSFSQRKRKNVRSVLATFNYNHLLYVRAKCWKILSVQTVFIAIQTFHIKIEPNSTYCRIQPILTHYSSNLMKNVSMIMLVFTLTFWSYTGEFALEKNVEM